MGLVIFDYQATNSRSALFEMFYKVKGVSQKTKIGTVYAVLRTGKGENVSETTKTTGVSVNPAHFNTKTGKVSGKDVLHVEKNAQIQMVGAAMEKIARTAKAAGIVPTYAVVNSELEKQRELGVSFAAAAVELNSSVGDFHSSLKAAIAKAELELAAMKTNLAEIEMMLLIAPKPILFADKLEEYKKLKAKENVRASSIKNYNVLGNIVSRYNPQLALADINLEFFQDFQQHLIGRGVTNASIREMLGKFKSIFRYYANKEGISTAFLDDFKTVKAGEPNDVLFLTAKELKELENLPITTVGQRDIRQQFLFAVETGLRRSDYNISQANIKGEDLVVRTLKTGKVASIPFTSKARRLFDESGNNFRLIKEAQFNQGLRAICKKLPSMQKEVIVTKYIGAKAIPETFKKWELMTSHVARKTYAENALAKGADIIAVSEWLGHKSTKMLEQHYANKKQIAKREAHKVRS